MNNSFRIISYNLHKGFAVGNTQFLLEKMRHNIRIINADMVFLQEVVGENIKHTNKVRNWIPQQFEYLADEVWPHYAYGKNAIYNHGHHGNAILSKYPFEYFDNQDVSLIPTSQRGILFGKTLNHIHVVCIHFGLLNIERKKQVHSLCDLIQQKIPDDEPLIICGDFNDWNKKSDLLIRQRLNVNEVFSTYNGKLAATFPAWFPLFSMDRIYFRDLEIIDCDVLNGSPWNTLSDHCALYAEFKQP